MEPQAALDLTTRPSHRSFAGHVLALGVHVFIFGGLAYLTFLAQGGIPGRLLLIYVSSLPFAIAIGTVIEIRRARQRMAAHHVLAGCLSAVLFCGVGGILLFFPQQIIFTVIGSVAVVWLTRYSPAAPFLRPPALSDVAPSTAIAHRSLRAMAMLAGALVLLVAGVGLTGLAIVSQAERPGGLNITIG